MTLSAIILARNEEKMIGMCLKTLSWVNEILVIDDHSTDKTVSISEKYGATVINGTGNFAGNRNLGKEVAKSDWLLYVDADERVSKSLADEILNALKKPKHCAYEINRVNYQIGTKLKWGGWGNDKIVRLFEKKGLKKWLGRIHEHAEVEGTTGELNEPLYHLTHRSVLEGLEKSIRWTNIEAEQFYESGHVNITPVRLIKVVFSELFTRLIKRKGYRDGTEGWIEAMIQAMNRFIVYTRLWELQQKPGLEEKYSKIEKEIADEWKTK